MAWDFLSMQRVLSPTVTKSLIRPLSTVNSLKSGSPTEYLPTCRWSCRPTQIPTIRSLCTGPIMPSPRPLSSLKELQEIQINLQRSAEPDRKSTRLNSSHVAISYAVFCLKKKKAEHM